MSQINYIILDSFQGNPLKQQRDPILGDPVKWDDGSGTVYAWYEPEEIIIEPEPEPELPVVILSDFVVTSEGSDVTKVGDIYWIDTSTPFSVTGVVTDPSGVLTQMNLSLGLPPDANYNFVIINEKVVKQRSGEVTVEGDNRSRAVLSLNGMSFSNMGFAESGNFVVTAERMNFGLAEIGAPFRIEMSTIEFDALNG